MYKKYKIKAILVLFLIIFVVSLIYFNKYSIEGTKVLGSGLKSAYFIPAGANYISQNINQEGNEVLTFSTDLSEDQVKKFYNELLGINKKAPCIYNVTIVGENKDLNIVTVTFCK